jgi:4-amino-4-deoxy-L-arabinose transferase-like glycosyltransferase
MLDAAEAPRAVVAEPAPPTPPRQARLAPRPRHRPPRALEVVALLALLSLSAALELVGLQSEAYANTYYAAAVESMLASWHNFFFVSSDLGGFVSVDKPPLGMWVQVLSARLLGFNGVALLLPQALAGIASVGLLYLLVRRAFGGAAGLLAAAVLAVMPISVVTARNNTMDTTLVLTLLVAAWLISLATESASLRQLLMAAAVVGLAFNIKMLQAFLVLPGFALAYIALAPLTWRRKLVHLSGALAVLLVVSLSWSVAVDLTPASWRPYMGSSGSNSAIALALTYNGLGRVTQAIAPWLAMLHVGVPLDLDNVPGMAPGIGSPGFTRLFAPYLAGQASWLLAAAMLGGIFAAAAVWLAGRRRGADRRQSVALVVWGGWLLTCGAYFSFARFYHTYYLTMLGPAVAALVGIGMLALWRSYARREVAGWLLPLVLAASGVLEVHFASASPLWQARLEPWILVATIGGSLALIAAHLSRTAVAWQSAALGVALLGLLIAPTVWSVTSIQAGAGGAWLPAAAPSGAAFGPSGFRSQRPRWRWTRLRTGPGRTSRLHPQRRRSLHGDDLRRTELGLTGSRPGQLPGLQPGHRHVRRRDLHLQLRQRPDVTHRSASDGARRLPGLGSHSRSSPARQSHSTRRGPLLLAVQRPGRPRLRRQPGRNRGPQRLSASQLLERARLHVARAISWRAAIVRLRQRRRLTCASHRLSQGPPRRLMRI